MASTKKTAGVDRKASARKAAETRRFRDFMRVVQTPLPDHHFSAEDLTNEWHVGLLTRELWEAMSYQPRRDLMDLVNKAVIEVARKYTQG